jgi:hypothetical protein
MMLKITFHFSGSKKRKEGLWDVVDGFAGHLGMIGGGGYDTKTNDFEFYYDAHNNCECEAFPKKARISPKMRKNLVDFVKSIPGAKGVNSEVIK